MGLTHYWRRPTELPTELFKAAIRDVRQAVDAAGVPLAGFDGSGDPVFRDDVVVFNGRGAAALEPFEVRVVEFDRHGRSIVRSYCKTGTAPYDACVRVALITLEHHLRHSGFEVSSDDRADEWADAREVCQRTLGIGGTFTLVT